MGQVFKISEAASIAIHALILLGKEPGKIIPTKEIVKEFKVSDNHCAKVMQRLTKAGFIDAIRGPKGGFYLTKKTNAIFVLDIYEAIDGPLTDTTCFFQSKSAPCEGLCCGIFGDLMNEVTTRVRGYFQSTTLEDLINNSNKQNKGENDALFSMSRS